MDVINVFGKIVKGSFKLVYNVGEYLLDNAPEIIERMEKLKEEAEERELKKIEYELNNTAKIIEKGIRDIDDLDI